MDIIIFFAGEGDSVISALQWQDNITRLDPKQGEEMVLASCSYSISLVLTDGQLMKIVFIIELQNSYTYQNIKFN